MNSRVSWSVEGIDPSVRERAEAAARRAGMSLNDWLNSTIGASAPPDFRSPPDQRVMAQGQESADVADIHQRLDSITRQIERISQPRPRDRRSPQRRRPARRAGRRQAAQRRHFAPRRAAGADLGAAGTAAGPAGAAGQAAPGRDGRARRRPGLSSLPAAEPGLVRFCDRRNRRAPERTRCTTAAANAAAQRAAHGTCDGARDGAAPDGAASASGPGFFRARAPSVQDHEPDRGAAASRRDRAIDRRVPHRIGGDPHRHHRGDAAPGDRIDRKRNPLAVAAHRRHPPERHRRQGAGRHRTGVGRNPRSAALADAGGATGRL